MAPSDAQYEWCFCNDCKAQSPQTGVLQTRRHIRKSRERDEAQRMLLAQVATEQRSRNEDDVEPILLAPRASQGSIMQHNNRDSLFEDLFEDVGDVDGLLQEPGDPWFDAYESDSNNCPSQHDSTSDSDLEYQNIVPSVLEPDSSDEDDDGDLVNSQPIDPADDPLFLSRDSIRAFRSVSQDDADEDGQDDEDLMLDRPRAFDEHPVIRNAYVRASLAHNFHGTTHEATRLILGGMKLSLTAARNAAPSLEIPGLETMAQTLRTAEKRLGLDLDDFIVYLFLCDKCWRPHNPSELYKLSSPECSVEDCAGCLYESKTLSGGAEKRTPTLMVPFVPPDRAIQRILLQPGKLQQLNEWRGPGDEPGRIAPTMAEGYEAFPDPSKPMKDISDGYAWRSIWAGLERRRTGIWSLKDVDVRDVRQRFVSLPCGLVWQINLDWYVYK
jgi:hypothetical protein